MLFITLKLGPPDTISALFFFSNLKSLKWEIDLPFFKYFSFFFAFFKVIL